MSLLLLSATDDTTYIALSPITMTVSVVGYAATLGLPPIVKNGSYTPTATLSGSYTPIVLKNGRAG